MRSKPSFFQRITGSLRMRDEDESYHDFDEHETPDELTVPPEEEMLDVDGELAVDVYETPNSIIVKAMTAGVKKDNIEISTTRDTLTIRGERSEDRAVSEKNYHYRELYWGGFSRTITLPAEVEIEEARAHEENGLLVIELPKIDRNRQAKLKVH